MFRSAYIVPKERLAYRKLTALIIVQELNRAKLGTINKCGHTCAEIIGYIAKQMQDKLVSNKKEIE